MTTCPFNKEFPPDEWVFEYYLNIPALCGQDVSIRSVFNNTDDTPSMKIFYSRMNSSYKWKCFSSGLGGNAITLVSRIYGLDTKSAAIRIKEDYSKYGSGFIKAEYVPESRWQLESYEVRDWNKWDLAWWKEFGISEEILTFYNVVPLNKFTLKKDGEIKEQSFRKIYGYFNALGELMKIYTPERKRKFFKVKSFVQGADQVKDGDRIISLSSLKDVMAFHSLGIKGWKGIAPDSENTPLPQEMINKVNFTLYDNDFAGYKAMLRSYNDNKIPFIVLGKSKDLSDNIKDGNKEYCLHTLRKEGITNAIGTLEPQL